jgi:hypothetical protein
MPGLLNLYALTNSIIIFHYFPEGQDSSSNEGRDLKSLLQLTRGCYYSASGIKNEQWYRLTAGVLKLCDIAAP